ncbi:hypothetical protein HanRHA438_Chr16g0768271 [Helianthus annuus]|nr:hypothetical protein HanRHA438_Chr16g0768271 [Helianthus annuus]
MLDLNPFNGNLTSSILWHQCNQHIIIIISFQIIQKLTYPKPQSSLRTLPMLMMLMRHIHKASGELRLIRGRVHPVVFIVHKHIKLHKLISLNLNPFNHQNLLFFVFLFLAS